MELINYLETKRISLCAIQEQRICYKDDVRRSLLGGSWELFTASANDRGVGRVGFLLSMATRKALENVQKMSSRIIKVQLSARETNTSNKVYIFSVHASTNTVTCEEKGNFYADLETHTADIPSERSPLHHRGLQRAS